MKSVMKQGFTLIELVVVVAIIGILMSISLAGIGRARERSRDARRIADIRTIQSALEMHAFNDLSRSYPPDNASEAADKQYCATNGGATNFGIYNNKCFQQYLASVPKDPNGVKEYQYHRPACLTLGTDGNSKMITNKNCTISATVRYAAGYGLHADLEADNNEAKNDASPGDAMSYDIMQ